MCLCARVVEMLIKLLVRNEGKGNEVMNLKRFEEEFTGEELAMPQKNRRPEDYERLFSGNTDDTFRLGLTLTKKCVKVVFYIILVPFYLIVP